MSRVVFHSVQANKGDAFIIEWGGNALIIDGGTPNTYGKIYNRIKNKNIKYVFVTHVDKDHIGGIVHLINKSNIDIKNTEFYMNHPDLYSYYSGEEVKYQDGDTLKEILESKGKQFNSVYFDKEQTIIDGELKIETLSPTLSLVKKLNKNWTASQVRLDDKLTYLERQKNNGDIINGSSIAQLISCDNIKLLMLADSHSDVVVNSLKCLGYNKDNPIDVSLVKLSHHGSKHNTSRELLEIVKTSKYYVSTNGAGNSYHPHKETIELISEINDVHEFEFSEIYTNYNIKNKIDSKFSELPSNIRINHCQTLEFS